MWAADLEKKTPRGFAVRTVEIVSRGKATYIYGRTTGTTTTDSLNARIVTINFGRPKKSHDAQFQGDFGGDALGEVGDVLVGLDILVGCLVGEELYEFLRNGSPERRLGNEKT